MKDLISIRYPDVFHLHGLAQKGETFALPGLPIQSAAVIHKSPFEVAYRQAFDLGRLFAIAETPHRIDIVMRGQHRQQSAIVTRHNIDHAGRHIRGFHDLVEVGGGESRGRVGHDHHTIAERDCRCQQRYKCQQASATPRKGG